MRILCALFPLLLVAVSGCSSTQNNVQKTIHSAQLGATKNVHRLGDNWFAGQPDAQGLKEAKAAGVRTVLNLRTPQEQKGGVEERQVALIGMEYINIPFGSIAALTDEVFERTRFVLSSVEHRPILLHCKSANRVGAIWYAHRVLDDHISRDVAMAEAKMIGLRSKGLIKRAQEYVGQMQASNASFAKPEDDGQK